MANFDTMTIGVNSEVIGAYLQRIESDVIEKAKGDLTTEEEKLFEVLKRNWHGLSEEKFEQNMREARQEISKSLSNHYTALQEKIYAVNNAWIAQDRGMIGAPRR